MEYLTLNLNLTEIDPRLIPKAKNSACFLSTMLENKTLVYKGMLVDILNPLVNLPNNVA